MSIADTMRTAQSLSEDVAAQAAPVGDAASLHAALREANITVPQLLRARAALHGDKLALREKDYGIWNPYSWSHYYESARAVAFGLMSLGIKPGDRVAIAGENTPEWFYADLGAQMIGAIAVGIYPTNPWPELQYIVRHSGSRVVVTGDQEQTDKVLDAMANGDGLPALEAIVCIDMKGLRNYRQPQLRSFAQLCESGRQYVREQPEANVALDRLISQGKPDDTCIFVYTSGTTGPPKGAMLSHRNLLAMTLSYFADVDQIAADDCILHPAPMSHGSGMYILPHVAAAAKQVIPASGGFDPGEIFDLISVHRGAAFFAAPTMVHRLVDFGGAGAADTGNLKTIVYGGGPMYVEDCKRAMALFGNKLAQIYGQGESPMTITTLT
ncbi:MAG: AMP-binding protein, partial [Bradyrhizobium sp.]|nr:AMP-binding protein [Bradyrhizobium sp.]